MKTPNKMPMNSAHASLAAKRRAQQEAAQQQKSREGAQSSTKASYKVTFKGSDGKTKEVPGWLNRMDDVMTALTRKNSEKTGPEMSSVRFTPLWSRQMDVGIHRINKYTEEGRRLLIGSMKLTNPTWQDYLCTFEHHALPDNWAPSQWWHKRFEATKDGDVTAEWYEIKWPGTTIFVSVYEQEGVWYAEEAIPVTHGRDETAQRLGGTLVDRSYGFPSLTAVQAFIETLCHEAVSCPFCAMRAQHDLAVALHRRDPKMHPMPDYSDYLGTREDSDDKGSWCPVSPRMLRTLVPVMDHSWHDVTPFMPQGKDRMASYARRTAGKRADGKGSYIRGVLMWMVLRLDADKGKDHSLVQNFSAVLEEIGAICSSCVDYSTGVIAKHQHVLTTESVVCMECGHPAPVRVLDTDGGEHIMFLDEDTVRSRDDLPGVFATEEYTTECPNCGTVGRWATMRSCSTCDDPQPMAPENFIIEATYDATAKMPNFRIYRDPKTGRSVFNAEALAFMAAHSEGITDWPSDLRAARDRLLGAMPAEMPPPFVSLRNKQDAAKVLGLDLFEASA